jgi:glycosyltransferase involved in cell wall biosynthesis
VGQLAVSRLAVVDVRFPWRVSGFRYWESLEILRQRPDTLFFAAEVLPEEFPAPVHPIAEFERLSRLGGITDVYCVFLNVTLSVLGRTRLPSGATISGAMPELELGGILAERGIRVHAMLYPGGGLEPQTPSEFLRAADAACATIFTNVAEVRAAIPRALPVGPIVNTEIFGGDTESERAAGDGSGPIELTFCHFRAERKNFPVLAEAFNGLDDGFHLNVIGNWESELHRLTNPRYTFHGLLAPERVAEIYRRSLVFVSCNSEDRYSLDGFPTTSAADAMASGCLLVATNYRADHQTIQSGVDYFEVEAGSAEPLRRAFLWARDHPAEARAIARHGAATARRLFDSRRVVARKLSAIFGVGFEESRA